MAGPRLRNSPLKYVVCECKFPAKPDYATSTVESIARALDNVYDGYAAEDGMNVQIGPAGVNQRPIIRHKFDDGSGWAVALTNETFTLESEKYVDVDDFVKRWRWIWGAMFHLLAPRRMARLGLRYVNHVPLARDARQRADVADMVDERLLASWDVLGEAGRPVASLQELRLQPDASTITMRHGLIEPRTYLLDFDQYVEPNVRPDLDATVEHIRAFNEQIARAFRSSVSDAGWDSFGPEDAAT